MDGSPRFQRKSRTLSRRKIEVESKKFSLEVVPHWRPKVRGDCKFVSRPCPYVSCGYSLYLDVSDKGSIQFNFPDKEPNEMAESCALDAADIGGMTLSEVGERFNVTRERVRQIEATVVPKLETVMRGWGMKNSSDE